jgi:hypothetical protein
MLFALVNCVLGFKIARQVCPLRKPIEIKVSWHVRGREHRMCALSDWSVEMDASGDIRRVEGQKSFPNGLAATLRAIRRHVRTGENKRRTTKAFALEFGVHYDAVMGRYRPSDKTISNP